MGPPQVMRRDSATHQSTSPGKVSKSQLNHHGKGEKKLVRIKSGFGIKKDISKKLTAKDKTKKDRLYTPGSKDNEKQALIINMLRKDPGGRQDRGDQTGAQEQMRLKETSEQAISRNISKINLKLAGDVEERSKETAQSKDECKQQEKEEKPGELDQEKRCKGAGETGDRQAPRGNSWERLGLHRMNENSRGKFKGIKAVSKARPKLSKPGLDKINLFNCSKIITHAMNKYNPPRDSNRETEPIYKTKGEDKTNDDPVIHKKSTSIE